VVGAPELCAGITGAARHTSVDNTRKACGRKSASNGEGEHCAGAAR